MTKGNKPMQKQWIKKRLILWADITKCAKITHRVAAGPL